MLTLRKRYTIFVVALLMTVGHVPSRAQPNDTAATSVSAKLADLNMDFISLYRAQTPTLEGKLPLIVVINNDAVTAIEPHQKTRYAFSPDIYDIKAALHAVLAYQGLMTALAAPKPVVSWQEADRFLSMLTNLQLLIAQTTASETAKQETLAVIKQLENATRTAITQLKVTPKDIATTLSSVEPKVMSVVNEIGQASADAMIAGLKAIKEKATPSVWEKVIVVVPGPATARVNNLGLAAASAVLGESALGRQIFYSEAIFDDAGILRYVQMLMNEKHFSTLMFDQPYRMWRDVFAETSTKYLVENTGALLNR
jgi:predicted XRE-type DNA-binding protein